MGRQRERRRPPGRFLTTAGADERQLERQVRPEEAQELRRLLIRPVQILEHDDAAAERVEELAQRTKDPVPLGEAIRKRLGRRG